MHFITRFRCAVLLVLALTSTLFAADAPAPLTLGINTWIGWGAGFVAKEKGFFGDLPVEFVIMDDWGVRQNAFISGKTQLDCSTVDTFALSAAQTMKGKVIWIADESSGADGIVSTPAVKTAADLKGKKVAYTRGSCSHFLLIRFLETAGLTMNDITRVEVDDPGRGGDAFMAGSVDAAVTWEPMITQIVKSGKGKVLTTTRTFPGQLVDCIVVRPEVLESRQADLNKLLVGWAKAVEFIKTNPVEAQAIIAKNFKIDPKEIAEMAKGVTFADISRNKGWLLSPKAATLFNDAGKAWVQEKLIAKPVAADTAFDSAFVEKLK